MKLSQRIIALIISIASLALLGLVFLQLHLLNSALQLKRQTFSQNVQAALDAVVRQFETREIVAKVISFSFTDSMLVNETSVSITVEADKDSGWTNRSRYIATETKIQVSKDRAGSTGSRLHLPAIRHVEVVLSDSPDGQSDPDGQHYVNLKEWHRSGDGLQFTFLTDSTHHLSNLLNGGLDSLSIGLDEKRKRVLIDKVLEDFSLGRGRSIEERINFATLDSLMNQVLEDRKIKTSFGYGIVSTDNDSVVLAIPPHMAGTLADANFRTRLFPNDLFAAPNELVLYFPDQDLFLLKQIGFQAIVSLLLILVVTGVFVYTIRTIFKQRAFSERLTNFINNMTHEFKTPISTISLATESMKNPAIRNDDSKLLQYADIIKDENIRMQNQVEKILQMAVIEDGDYELNLTSVNVHQLIKKAIQNVSLQVEKKKGRISASLQATRHVVQADALHFSNIIHNLLDNAIKYTRDRPDIKVATENINGSLRISIEDNGIGLGPQEQERVFDKYYRVPTGNVHDVKGFGLGLSYVKHLVEAHHGSIDLRSELDKGTVFDIQLPVEHAAQ